MQDRIASDNTSSPRASLAGGPARIRADDRDLDRDLDRARHPAVTRPSAGTVSAYETTRYFAQASEPVLLRIGDEPQRLRDWLEKMSAQSATIMTAWNPQGEETPAAENDRAQAQLLSSVRAHHLRWLPATGEDPAGVWKPEPGFCVFDLPEDVLDQWLVIYRQNAAVRVARERSCHLVWHPSFRSEMQAAEGAA